ncbi:MAG: glycosyltransferase family 39 protein, partial [Anaerolineae bacterium]|nr:glycosyltransferase family 39 protein [Anaerolineae bacterium]
MMGQSEKLASQWMYPRNEKQLSWATVWTLVQRGWGWLLRAPDDPLLVWGLLIVVLLLAAALRLTGLDWDEHQHLHPDERFLTMVENSLRWPKSLKEYFDSSVNPLNPYNHGFGTYVYGLFPVIVAKFFGQLTGKVGYDGVYLVGRAMSAVMDMLSILFVFLLGRRLYGPKVGLLGALLLSLTVLDIQHAHFFTVDTSTTFFVTFALYWAVRVAQGRGWGSILMLGVAFGLAVSCKISVLTFLLIIGLAFLLRISAEVRSERESRDLIALSGRLGRLWLTVKVEVDRRCGKLKKGERFFFRALWAGAAIVVVLVVALLVFRVAQPQAFTGPGFLNFRINPKWKQDMIYVRKLISGEIDYPPSHQWTAREPVWYMFKNMVLWGQGLPLGIAVWLSWALMAYELYKKHRWVHLLPWTWMTFTFFYQSVQFVKPVRYLLPIYPTTTLVAAYGLVWLWEKFARHRGSGWQRWTRPLAGVLVGAVVLGTAFWAFAFTSIYTRPVTRIAASRWIYAHIPPGSTISFEVWDDPVPLNIDGHNASREYRHVKMDLYWEDIPEKREKLYSWLEQTEYIALTSNRLYGSIPRLSMRYPMTTRYYEALFSGELGYDRLITFTSRPKLFGIEIVDDNADESFTVYDHPKVIIFKKRPDFSIQKVRALFDGIDLERIVRVMPRQVTQAPNGLMLTTEEWELQRRGGTWSKIFHRNSFSNQHPTFIWLLAFYLLGLVGFPIGFVAFRSLRDRGYVFSKTLGLLLVAYLSWLLPSLKWLPYTRKTITVVLLGLVLVSAAIAYVQRGAIRDYLRLRWRLLLANEVCFLGFFALFWLIRWGNPDLWHPVMGGEKPMDFAYLNAIIKSTYFPPYDPWFAGGYINYYYFGWVVVATVIKLTGIVPWVAYNLAIPTWFGMVAMGACSVVFNLIPAGQDEEKWFPRALRYGLLGAALVAVVGNLGEVRLLVQGLTDLAKDVQFQSSFPILASLVRLAVGLWRWLFQGRALPFRSEWWYWNASRIMSHGEINEFPFFTFLYADLHAHLTAMPFALLALGLAVSLVRSGQELLLPKCCEEQNGLVGRWLGLSMIWKRVNWSLLLRLSLLALVVGELWCNNSWDFPTYLGISFAALGIGLYELTKRINQKMLTQWVLQAGYLLVMSALLFRPYHAHFGLAYSSVEPWKGPRTPLGDYLLIHGLTLFVLVSYLLVLLLEKGMRNGVARAVRLFLTSGGRRRRAWELYGRLVHCQTLAYELAWVGLSLLLVFLLALAAHKAWVPFLGVPVLVLASALTFYSKAHPAKRFQTLLIALGMALTLAVEYVVLKGDIGRMNTVFKFYLQVWIIWNVVAAVALERLFREQRFWSPGWTKTWRTGFALLLLGVSLYPIFATYGKVRDRWDPSLPPGLDGMQYMTTARYHDNNRELVLENDRRAIVWLQDHVIGSPVIAEANTPLYRWGSRISIYTGLPTIIGWDWHQKQQRAAIGGQVVDWRLQDLRELYNTHDVQAALKILRRYQVSYIYVGELERAYYDPQGLAKFEDMVGSYLEIVYRRGPVTIYKVKGSDARELATLRGGFLQWLSKHWVGPVVRAEGPAKEPSGNLTEGRRHRSLMLDVPVDQLPVLRDRGWSPWANQTWGAIFFWWFVLELIGFLAWPLTARVWERFADRGYAMAKAVGLLIVAYLVWVGASLRVVSNSPPVAWLAVLLLGGGAFFLWRRRGLALNGQSFSLRLVFLEEALFTGAFGAFVGIRLLNPDLWHPFFGGEKMMEIAFLNAITKSAYMPPYDPYFAGGYINYYYYGQFLVALLVKLTGIVPEVAFNLAVPTFFALTVGHAFFWATISRGRLPSIGCPPKQGEGTSFQRRKGRGSLLLAFWG